MNIEMFIVGGVIWVAYMYFTIWNIWYNSKSAKKDKQTIVAVGILKKNNLDTIQ